MFLKTLFHLIFCFLFYTVFGSLQPNQIFVSAVENYLKGVIVVELNVASHSISRPVDSGKPRLFNENTTPIQQRNPRELHTTCVSFLERVAGSLGYGQIIRCAEKSRDQSLVVEVLAHLDGCR